MLRRILCVIVLFAPTVVLLGSVGCEKKTTTVQETEERRESTPEMVSPGTEIVE